jgi:hypothetical protein
MRRNLTLHVCANAAAKLAMLVVCCCGMISPAFAAEEQPAEAASDLRITVAVIDSAHVGADTLARAERDAGRALGYAGISVAWIEIDTKLPTSLPLEAIVLRIEPEAGPKHNPKALGVALAPGPGGVYASIFFDRIRESAADPVLSTTGAGLVSLMGHAIAHEIGHLLLGQNSHARHGLMSGDWTVSDLRSLAKGQFNFRPDEAKKMRSEVARRNGESKRAEVAEAH